MNRRREFSDKLKECRIRAGYSHAASFARDLGFERAIITKAENADKYSMPSYDVFLKMKAKLKTGNNDLELEALEKAWLATRPAKELVTGKATNPTDEKIDEVTGLWPSSSREYIGIFEDITRTLNNWQEYYLAQHDRREGNLSIAQSSLENLIHRVTNQDLLRMLSYHELAICRRYLVQPTQDIVSDLDHALDIAENIFRGEEYEIHGDILIIKGDLFRRAGQLDEALSLYNASQEKFTKVTDMTKRTKAFGRIERKIAGTLLYQGKATQAEYLCKSSISKFKSIQDNDGILKGEQHLAWAKVLQGYYDDALDIHMRHLENLEGNSHTSELELSKAQSYYAEILRMCGRLDDAERFFTLSENNLKRFGEKLLFERDILIRGPIYVGLGLTLIARNNLDDAEAVLNKSEVVNKEAGYFFARTIDAIGKLAMAREKWDEAYHRFQSAEDMYGKMQNDYYTADILISKVELYFRQHNYIEAKAWGEEALKMCSNDEDLSIQKIRAQMWLTLIGLTGIETIPDSFVHLHNSIHQILQQLANKYLLNEVFEELENLLPQLRQSNSALRTKEFISNVRKLQDLAISTDNRLNQILTSHIQKLETITS